MSASTFPKCATCKHLGRVSGVILPAETLVTKHHYCERIHNGFVEGEAESQPALVACKDGFMSWLHVLPDFGCVLHEADQDMFRGVDFEVKP